MVGKYDRWLKQNRRYVSTRRRIAMRSGRVRLGRKKYVSFSNLPVRFVRTFYLRNIVPSTTTTGNFWTYEIFNFGQLPNSAEYTSLFDQYKITGVKVTLRPRYDNFAGNDTTDTTLPGITSQGSTKVHIMIDPTYRGTPTGTYNTTTLNTFLENGKVRTYEGNKPITFFLKAPMIENTNVVGTQRVLARKQWLPTDTTNVTHYGYHIFMNDVNFTGTFNQSFDVFYTYYFQCKNQK